TVTAGNTGTIYTFTPPSDGEFFVSAWVSARDTGSDRAWYHCGGSYKVISSALTAVTANDAFVTHEDDATWDVVWSASGSDIILTGTADGTNDTTFEGNVLIISRT